MARSGAAVLGDGAARNLVDPRPEALVVAQVAQTSLHSQKHILQHVVDLGRGGHAPRHEGPQAGLEIAVGAAHVRINHASAPGEQHDGPQLCMSEIDAV